MTAFPFELFLDVATALCAVMVFVNLVRIKSRKASAFILAAAFIDFGILLQLVKHGNPQWQIYALGFVLFLLLTADVAVRASSARQS